MRQGKYAFLFQPLIFFHQKAYLVLLIASGSSPGQLITQLLQSQLLGVTGLPVRTITLVPTPAAVAACISFHFIAHHIRSGHINMQKFLRRDKHPGCGLRQSQVWRYSFLPFPCG